MHPLCRPSFEPIIKREIPSQCQCLSNITPKLSKIRACLTFKHSLIGLVVTDKSVLTVKRLPGRVAARKPSLRAQKKKKRLTRTVEHHQWRLDGVGVDRWIQSCSSSCRTCQCVTTTKHGGRSVMLLQGPGLGLPHLFSLEFPPVLSALWRKLDSQTAGLSVLGNIPLFKTSVSSVLTFVPELLRNQTKKLDKIFDQ